MRKIFVIARRDYRAAVRTKAFIITMVLMPVLMGASVGIQYLFKKLDNVTDKRFAIIDRTPGHVIAPMLQLRAEQRNTKEIFDAKTGAQTASKYILEVVLPERWGQESLPILGGGPAYVPIETLVLPKLRLELSDRIEKDELEAIVEFGPDILKPRDPSILPEDVPERASVRFQSKSATALQHRFWIQREATIATLMFHFKDLSIDPALLQRLQQIAPVHGKSLTKRDKDGKPNDAPEESRIVNFILPGILIGLMFMVIMVGATPAMQGIVEEKSQRIAEVLLGSLTPFQLMAGKLLGVIGVSLTMAAVYFTGGYIVAQQAGYADALSPGLIVWFLFNLILALLMFGSLFIAVGAAAADIKDTQTLLMPIMIIACLPFFALAPIMQEPNGPIARVCTFFPFSTPMLLVARESVGLGVPLWEKAAAVALVLATTLFCVWAAGRIFRVGILMTGKGAKFTEMIRWIFRS